MANETYKGIEVSGIVYDNEDETARNGVNENASLIGKLANLGTTAKTNLVNAINEVFALTQAVDIPFSSLTNVNNIFEGVETNYFRATRQGNLVMLSFSHVTISSSATGLGGDVEVLSGLPKTKTINSFGWFYSIENKQFFLGYVTVAGKLFFSQGQPGSFSAGHHIYGTLSYFSA